MIAVQKQPSPTASRRRFLTTALSVGIGTPFVRPVPVHHETFHPFSPARTVVLPRRLGRRHLPARRAIEREVEVLAGEGHWRLPAPKVEALLQVADAVTEYYGIGHRLEAWAERIPIEEAWIAQSGSHYGVLNLMQPGDPVLGAGSPVDWWLFLAPEPIEWASLDGLPVHVLVAHVKTIDFPKWLHSTYGFRSDAWRLLRDFDAPGDWSRLARSEPLDAVRRLNAAYAASAEGGR